MFVEKYQRKSFPVDAVQVTEANFDQVVAWCDGSVHTDDNPNASRYIKVRVHNPLTERQTKAFVGDWVLYAGKGYKVYTDKAFRKSFDAEPAKHESVDQIKNVFEAAGLAQTSLPTTSKANPGGTNSG